MRKQIQYAIQQMLDTNDRIIYARPYIASNYVTAFCGKAIMIIPKDKDTTPNELADGPDALKIIDREATFNDWFAVSDLENAANKCEKCVTLYVLNFPKDTIARLVRTCRILGIKHLQARCDTDTTITFKALYRGKAMFFKIINCYYENEGIAAVTCGADSIECDLDAGRTYYEKYIKEEQLEKEQYEKGNWPCFEVTLARYHTVIVKARNIHEAEDIAIQQTRDSDFTDNIEMESYTETTRYDAETFHKEYLDENGRHKFEEEEKN